MVWFDVISEKNGLALFKIAEAKFLLYDPFAPFDLRNIKKEPSWIFQKSHQIKAFIAKFRIS